ncbi:hypothetical protein C1S82_14845 [Mycolicibacterium cosmeticum]|uniref:CAS/CSE protein involved in chromosome segregation n=1 Tax=Mycolicibacterium cosmeticum TaxID=258533 RepID=W9BL20_MYCCO|nr:hypothetical protein [Mycolicibacterium cosmeticum]TLH73260.1 hypothetical protein C1S82_14845 [Mycolicibacterium cosmeticum]CDO08885.1 CAS/CSE protein involved in chromosome segregation [Mycolicibacterium cosmeticum]
MTTEPPPRLYALDLIRGSVHRIDVATGESHDLATGLEEAPDGIIVDEAEGYAYFTLMGRPDTPLEPAHEPPFTARNGSIQRVALTGGAPEIVVDRGRFTTGKQLATDPRTGRLFWCDREGGAVYRCERDGTAVTRLIDNANADLPAAERECVGIAVDPTNDWLYWTQKGPSDGGKGRILRAPLDIPQGTPPEARTDIEILWDGLPEPIDLELNEEHQILYWTDRGTPPNGNTLNRAHVPEPGDRGVTPDIIAHGFSEAIGVALDLPNNVAYVSDLSGAIRQVDLSTGNTRVIAVLAGAATGIALVH